MKAVDRRRPTVSVASPPMVMRGPAQRRPPLRACGLRNGARRCACLLQAPLLVRSLAQWEPSPIARVVQRRRVLRLGCARSAGSHTVPVKICVVVTAIHSGPSGLGGALSPASGRAYVLALIDHTLRRRPCRLRYTTGRERPVDVRERAGPDAQSAAAQRGPTLRRRRAGLLLTRGRVWREPASVAEWCCDAASCGSGVRRLGAFTLAL